MRNDLPAELPDPATFTLSTYTVAGRVYQRAQDERGVWHGVLSCRRPRVRRQP